MQLSLRYALTTVAFGGLASIASAQEFCDQMEDYAAGSFLTGNNGWQMWGNGPSGEHDITNLEANSGTKSVRTWGVADIVHGELTAPITTGVWEGSVWQYIADGTADELVPGDTTWFIYLSEFDHPGGQNTWIVQVEFNGDGSWTIDAGNAGGSTNTGTYVANDWREVKFVADLHNDLIEVFYDGASMAPAYSISGTVFGGGGGPVALDVYNMYTPTSGMTSVAYYDDWLLEEQGSNGQACGSAGVIAYCTPKSLLFCGPPSISHTGTPQAGATSGFTISAGPALGNKYGWLAFGLNGSQTPAIPFTGGFLCVKPRWLGTCIVYSGGMPMSCDGMFSMDFNTYATGLPVPGSIPGTQTIPPAALGIPGTQVNVQWFGQDTASTGSFMSDALQFVM